MMDDGLEKSPTQLLFVGRLYRLLHTVQMGKPKWTLNKDSLLILLHMQRRNVWLDIACLSHGSVFEFSILWDAWDEYFKRIA